MKVFISWSGESSKHVANALRDWLPKVIQAVQPWMSEVDIASGSRWGSDVERELRESKFGILCVTSDNQRAPWLLFEAGALAKATEDKALVCPYLYGLQKSEMEAGPLTQFQARLANQDETFQLVRDINSVMTPSLGDEHLVEALRTWWPKLEGKLKETPKPQIVEPKRGVNEMLGEVLVTSRETLRKVSALEQQPNRFINDPHPYWGNPGLMGITNAWGSSPIGQLLVNPPDVEGPAPDYQTLVAALTAGEEEKKKMAKAIKDSMNVKATKDSSKAGAETKKEVVNPSPKDPSKS